MAVDYDRSRCVKFVDEVKLLSDTDCVLVWLIFQDRESPMWRYRRLAKDQLRVRSLVKTFKEMSLWNQQAVLYYLIPVLDAIAQLRALDRCSLARQQEPL